MKTIAQSINTIISRKPFLAELLAEGIINISSLARKIKPELEDLLRKPVQNGAVVMALNRFIPQTDLQTTLRIRKIFNKIGDIIVRSNLSAICFRNSASLFERQLEIIHMAITRNELFYTFAQGVYESTMVISSIIADECKKIMKEEAMINQSHDLSAITLKLPVENISEPGIYYFILQNIAWEGINIMEVISTSNEFTIVVQRQDVDNAFRVLNSILKLSI